MVFFLLNVSGEVIRPNALKYIEGEGMPVYKDPFNKGKLIISFQVKFPKTFPVEKIPKLEALLPKRVESIIPDVAEECVLVDYDPAMDRDRHRSEAYDSDDEGPYGGQRVQCQSH